MVIMVAVVAAGSTVAAVAAVATTIGTNVSTTTMVTTTSTHQLTMLSLRVNRRTRKASIRRPTKASSSRCRSNEVSRHYGFMTCLLWTVMLFCWSSFGVQATLVSELSSDNVY